ncbi:MAG TPA: hypothetical protein VGL63_11925 [Streptosporangiaceae bacterium]
MSSPSAVAYSSRLRSHGVPNCPDPGSGGAIPKGSPPQLGVINSQFQTAQSACHYLLPNTGGSFQQQDQQCVSVGDCPPALVQRMLRTSQLRAPWPWQLQTRATACRLLSRFRDGGRMQRLWPAPAAEPGEPRQAREPGAS